MRRGMVLLPLLSARRLDLRRLLAATLIILDLVTPALAQSRYGSSYDWRSGSSYQWQRNYDGSTDVRAYNNRTGSRWNTTIEPDGDMRGRDSQGNSWRYDSGTGRYWNSNGTVCTGKGWARTCY